LPPDSPDLGSDLHNLGSLYFTMRHYQEAAPLLRRALDIRTKALGLNDRDTIQTLETYANLLYFLHRDADIEMLRRKNWNRRWSLARSRSKESNLCVLGRNPVRWVLGRLQSKKSYCSIQFPAMTPRARAPAPHQT